MEAFLNGMNDDERMASFWFGAMFIQFIRGETDLCLDEYQKLLEAGPITRWWPTHEPGYVAFKDIPRYQRIRADLRADLAKMRAKLPPEILAVP